MQPYENTVNYKRKLRRRFFLLIWSRTPPISSEFRGEVERPLGTPLLPSKARSPKWYRTFRLSNVILYELFHPKQKHNVISPTAVRNQLKFLQLHFLQAVTDLSLYRGADKSLARPGRKQATATEDFEFHIGRFHPFTGHEGP